MSPAQIDLLRRLIAADRAFHSRRAAGLPVHPDDRGVEVGSINGISPSTAASLERCGLIDICDTARNSRPWAFLGSCSPYDHPER